MIKPRLGEGEEGVLIKKEWVNILLDSGILFKGINQSIQATYQSQETSMQIRLLDFGAVSKLRYKNILGCFSPTDMKRNDEDRFDYSGR